MRYRSAACIQPWGVGPPDSDGVSRVPPYSGAPPGGGTVSRTGLSPSPARLSRRLRCRPPHPLRGPPTPGDESPGLGSSAFARRYWRNLVLFLFLGVLRCFTSPGVAPRPYGFRPGSQGSPCGVAPFGDPRVTGRLRLAVEYRRLPRPSSPSAAKASVMRPKSLAAKPVARPRLRTS